MVVATFRNQYYPLCFFIIYSETVICSQHVKYGDAILRAFSQAIDTKTPFLHQSKGLCFGMRLSTWLWN